MANKYLLQTSLHHKIENSIFCMLAWLWDPAEEEGDGLGRREVGPGLPAS
jgi:hypothetical protein